MKQLIKLAWRNIWRKGRRSLIAITSIAFGLTILISLRSLMLGNYDKMNEAGTKNTGHLQVHAADYWKDKSINDLLEESPAFESKLKTLGSVEQVFSRLQNYALASTETITKAVMVNGINPDLEDDFTKLSKRLVNGKFLNNSSTGVMLAEGLAQYLKLKVGDTLVLVGQGYHATIAAGRYPIEGIVKLGNPQMNLSQVYLSLPTAQGFYSAEGLVSAYFLTLQNIKKTEGSRDELRQILGGNYEGMTWKEMLPEIKNSQRIDSTIFTMLSFCLFLIVGMGIIGTILMMTLERKKEFGVLQAIGFQKREIKLLLIVEALFLGLLGIGLAFIIAIPFVLYMNANPIPLTGDSGKAFEAMGVEPVLQLGVKPALFALMASVVLGIMFLATIFPILFVKNLKINEAIK
jgi:ABC-type lipoprotein release transport system permease subunit